MMGAGRVIGIDRVPERLAMAQDGKTETINFDEVGVYDRLMEMTGGRGPDRVIDCVGCEAHHTGAIDAVYDKAKTLAGVGTDRAHAIREAIMCCRKAGTVSIPAVYVGFPDKFPLGAAMNKGLTFKMGQTHTQRYAKKLLERIQAREIDPSFVITHRLQLEEGPAAYRAFRDKQDGCIKVVLKP
jgi:threonine dehydrogenase-like Zn-dependent dehydrogenase